MNYFALFLNKSISNLRSVRFILILMVYIYLKQSSVSLQDSSPDSALPITQKKFWHKTLKCDAHADANADADVRVTTIPPWTGELQVS